MTTIPFRRPPRNRAVPDTGSSEQHGYLPSRRRIAHTTAAAPDPCTYIHIYCVVVRCECVETLISRLLFGQTRSETMRHPRVFPHSQADAAREGVRRAHHRHRLFPDFASPKAVSKRVARLPLQATEPTALKSRLQLVSETHGCDPATVAARVPDGESRSLQAEPSVSRGSQISRPPV